ncbi:MAG TPA: hypothetical protein VIY52_27240 [Streptosporangiaceae bacterium]
MILASARAARRHNEAHACHPPVHPQLDHLAAAGPRRAQLAAAEESPGQIPRLLRLITGVLPGGEQIPLFRLRYGGSAHSFGFAIYSAAHDRYEDAVLIIGLPIGTPQEALDTACTIHLTGLGHEPGD